MKKAVFALLVVSAVLASGELVLRRVFPAQGPESEISFNLAPLVHRAAYLFDPRLFWRLRPGGRDGDIPINKAGFRGESVPLKRVPGKYRVALLGDSVLYGFNLREEDTIGERIRRGWLEPGGIEIHNAAVPGYSSFQAKRLLTSRILPYGPEAVIVYLGLNDANDARFFHDSEQPVLRMGAGTAWLALHRTGWYAAEKALLARLVPLGAGMSSAKNDIPRLRPGEFIENLREIDRAVRGAGAKIYFCRAARIWPNDHCIRSAFYDVPPELNRIDTVAAFGGACGEEAGRFFQRDLVHPTPEGARVIADAVLRALLGGH